MLNQNLIKIEGHLVDSQATQRFLNKFTLQNLLTEILESTVSGKFGNRIMRAHYGNCTSIIEYLV